MHDIISFFLRRISVFLRPQRGWFLGAVEGRVVEHIHMSVTGASRAWSRKVI
jgi:hypothetical protein